MGQMKTFVLLVLTLNLAGCLTLPVTGEYKDESEKFLGSATGYMNGTGDIAITTEEGATCLGTFRYLNRRVNGDGSFQCSNGRIGDFFFTSNGTEGEGFGKDQNGKLFRFKFGGPEYTRAAEAQWSALAAAFDSMSRAYRPTTSYCYQYGNSYRCTHYNY